MKENITLSQNDQGIDNTFEVLGKKYTSDNIFELTRNKYSEKEDLLMISEYLKMQPDGTYMAIISGLDPTTINQILKGNFRKSQNREHTKVVGELVRCLIELRWAGRCGPRTKSAVDWLENGRVRTSEGIKSPLKIFSNTKLATEARDETYAAMF